MNEPSHWTPQLIIAAIVTLLITGGVLFLAVTAKDVQERSILIGALVGAPGFGGAMFALGATQTRRGATTTTIPQDPPDPPIVVRTGAEPPGG